MSSVGMMHLCPIFKGWVGYGLVFQGAVVRVFVFLSRTVDIIHLGKGSMGDWIWPIGQSLEPPILDNISSPSHSSETSKAVYNKHLSAMCLFSAGGTFMTQMAQDVVGHGRWKNKLLCVCVGGGGVDENR